MKNIISINKLTYRYNLDFVLYNFNLYIKEGTWITLVGPNGSGKSTLIKILTGLIKTGNDILIADKLLTKENLREVRKDIGVVFENIESSFICETVREELILVLENLNYSKKNIDDRINEISECFNIKQFLNLDPYSLSGGEKQRVSLAVALINKPKILILDEAFCMIDECTKKDLLEILKKLNEKEKLTIINATHDLSESFYSNRLIVINKGEILLDGTPKDVMTYDKVLNKIGIEIPFIVDLSIKLKLYGLLDNITFDMNEMVNTLWK